MMCDRSKAVVVARHAALMLMGLLLPAGLGQTTSLVSVTINGTGGNATSGTPSVSRDGRFVAFHSESSWMVPDDNNSAWDVFLRDRWLNTTICVSVSSDGQPANKRSINTAISEDGRYVAFASEASNLVAGDTNGTYDIFLHDRITGQTERVSVDSAGNQANGLSTYPAMSATGRYVAFHSQATNLASGDTNGTWDAFLHDRVTGTTTWVSAGGNNESKLPAVSDDGQVVALESKASNLVAGDTNGVKDVFAYNLAAGTVERVSVASDGTQGDNESFAPTITADGALVAFASGATNLVPGDTNGRWDVLVRDRVAGLTTRVSVDSLGTEGNHNSVEPAISDDGTVVAFTSSASNLVANDTNAVADIFLHDLQTGTTELMTVSTSGVQGNAVSSAPRVSHAGQVVIFVSESTNLVPEDANWRPDVYAHERPSGLCDPPVIQMQPVGAAVCPQASVSFSATATGTPPLSYQWRQDGAPISGATAATYTIVTVSLTDAGSYDVQVTNGCGIVVSDAVPLYVGTTILMSPLGQAACLGGTATFTVVAAGPDPLTYQWQKDGVDIAGATEADLTLPLVSYADAAQYHVIVASPCGSVTSDPVELTVLEPVAIQVDPAETTICAGVPLTLNVTATGGGTLSYQWRKDGEVLPGQVASELYYSVAWDYHSGIYDVIVSNACSSATSAAATVIASTPVQITQQPDDYQAVCDGAPSVVFAVAATSPAPLNYQWRKNDVEIPGATEPTYHVAPVTHADAGRYRCAMSNVCGSVLSDSGNLVVHAPPTIGTSPESQTVCTGATVVFSVVAQGGTLHYQWRKDGVELPDATGSTLTLAAVAPADAGSYDVVVGNPYECGESTSQPAELTVIADVVPTIITQPADQTVCVGADVTFTVTATGTDLEYQWQRFVPPSVGFVDIPGATAAAYTLPAVSVSDSGASLRVIVSNGCETAISDEAVLLVDTGNVMIVYSPMDQIGCATREAHFSVTAAGTWPLRYQWRKDGSEVPGAAHATLVLADLTLDDAGIYDVIVSSTCGTATSDAAMLTVIAYDPPLITASPASQDVCEGTGVTLTVSASGVQPLMYQWRKDTVDIPGATSSSYTIPAFTPTDVGSYDVVVSNLCEAATSAAAMLTVSRLPVIDRHPWGRAAATIEAVTLVVEARGNALAYRWSKDGTDIPGATESAYTLDPVRSADQGEYAVCVANACGAVRSNSAMVTLVEPPRTVLASVSTGGIQATNPCTDAAISADGRYVALVAPGTELVPGGGADLNGHVVVRDRQTATTFQADANPHGWHTDGDSFSAVTSANGTWIAYESSAGNLVVGDTNGVADVFLLNKNTRAIARISTGAGGLGGNGASGHASITAQGGYVAFQSEASDLVPGDTNGCSDVFLYDRLASSLMRITLGLGGVEANGASRRPSFSANGRYVAFESGADNLVAGDVNGATDIFVYDRDPDENSIFDEGNAVLVCVSRGLGGAPASGASHAPHMAPGGRFVAFESEAGNLVSADSNGHTDVFVYDLASGAMIAASRSATGVLGNGDSHTATLSTDGRRVAFLSAADNLVAGDQNGLVDVFLRDRDPDQDSVFDEGNETTGRVSVAVSGLDANGASDGPMIAANGTVVVFQSVASNLVDNDQNGCGDIFTCNPATGVTTRLSIDRNESEVYGVSVQPFISGDGRYVVFASAADTLVQGDTNEQFDIFVRDLQVNDTAILTRGWAGNARSADAALSADGRYVVFESLATNLAVGDNAASDVFVRDGVTGVVELVSVNSGGVPANEASYDPTMSADGRFVAFISFASNLSSEPTNGRAHIYVRDRQLGTTVLASVGSSGTVANDWSYDPVISADGHRLAFASAATNLIAGDTNGHTDIFIRDLVAGTNTCASRSSSGSLGNGDSTLPALSGDARYVAFMSGASNLVPGDSNGQTDVFVRDLQTDTTVLVSTTPSGQVGDDGSGYPSLTLDGRYVLFDSGARNLVPDDNNLRVDVFVRDLRSGATTLVSLDDDGLQGNADSSRPAVSGDGRYVGFQSEASNLTPADQNFYRDIFVRDLGVLLTGDLNCDGAVDFGDINPFVLRLTDPSGYVAQFGACPDANGDINGNGSVGFDDINPFVALLTGK